MMDFLVVNLTTSRMTYNPELEDIPVIQILNWKTQVSDQNLDMEIFYGHSGHKNLGPDKVVLAFNPRRLNKSLSLCSRSA